MTPLAITTHLYSGFVAHDPWSPTIDGILAYWHMREKLGPEQFSINQGHSYAMKPVDDLPLQIERDGDWWWYACSSPIYTAVARAQRHIHRRFDQANAEKYLPEGQRKIVTKAGAYKNSRLTLPHIITDRVTWHAIGDHVEIERLLRNCHHIGGKIGAGFGRVRRWEITAGGDETLACTHRPLPASVAERLGIEGDPMWWGLRPPARIEANCTDCVMPRR